MTRAVIALLLLPGCIYVDKDKSGDSDTGLTTTGAPGALPTGATSGTTTDPDADSDGYPASVDCDDTNAAIHPDALETCDAIDNNCDSLVDDAAAATFGGVNYATLDELWPALVDGSDAAVCPGTWTVTLATLDTGAVTLWSVGGKDVTTISEAAGGVAFAVTGAGALTLDGFTITGSLDQALDVDEGGSLTVLNARITANGQGVNVYAGTNGQTPTLVVDGTDIDANVNASGNGGGVRAELGASVTITNSSITGNSAVEGGGLWASATFVPMTLVVTDTLIDGNTADRGAGASLTNVDFIGTGSTVSSNVAATTGGGFETTEAAISGVTILSNAAAEGGGVASRFNASFVGNPFDPDLTGVVIEQNTADRGAGIFVDGQTTVTLDSTSSLVLNVATTSGGGVWLDAASSTVVSSGADTGSYANGNDNAPDDVAAGPGLSVLYDDMAPFDCSGDGTCI